MNVKTAVDKFFGIFGYIKSSGFSKLWEMAKEYTLFGKTVTKPYAQVPNIYKAIKAIADNVPQAELVFKDWNSEKEVYPQELIDLFNNPNPLMSGSDFLQAITGFYSLYSEVFIVMTRSVGQEIGSTKLPAELWTFNPAKFSPITDKEGTVTAWRYGDKEIFPAEQIMHIKDFNPYNDIRGLAPTEPLKHIIEIDYASLIFNKAFFENNAMPPTFLKTDKVLPDTARDRLKTWWEQRHKGASKAFKLAILEAGLEPVNIGSSHQEMEFIEQMRYSREEMLGVWRVPKALFNITEDLNYATFMGQMRIFWHYTLAPILTKFENAFNSFLIKPFNENIYCEFDYSNVPAFQAEFKEKVEIAKGLKDLGFTANEINEKLKLGFEPKPWRDICWIPFSLVPAGDTPPDASGNPPEDPQDDPGKTAQPQAGAKDTRLRGMLWKQFVNRHTPLEIKFAGALKKFFFEQRKRVLENINAKDAAPIVITIDWEKEGETLKRYALPYLSAGIGEGMNLAESILGQSVDPEIIKQRLASYLTVRANRIKNLNETVKRQLKETIEEGLQAGETISQVADRVRNIYNMASSRSRTIARTETTGALNGGSSIYYEEAGVKFKRWLTAGDEAVRETHIQIDGEQRLLGERFSNGLLYPGDDGPAAEAINCRCTVEPVVSE